MIESSELRDFIMNEAKNALREFSESDSIVIDHSLDRCIKNKDIIFDFCMFCKEFLEIDHPLKIEL